MEKNFTNRLINETSPYLLQHAHNPVDWYAWGEEALHKARAEKKIILISIGYSACHWCHVMERESFEDESVAALMNEHLVNIKIDREERPDLDHIYMDALQAMTGSGGWPLNLFLTPEAKPFYGGTYFPPRKAYNRPAWTDIINGIIQSWKTKETEIRKQAENLTSHLLHSNDLITGKNAAKDHGAGTIFTANDAATLFENIMRSADTTWGGFGKAPKFPQLFTIQYLLQYHHFSGNELALNQAMLSLDKMLEGGIYDQVGGGIARYSTDEEWLAPHFEKMLYDNALLITMLCEVYLITKDVYYANAIRRTIGFVERELLHPDGGFYAAIDADSQGEEGKFYTWTKKEIDQLLGDDSSLFCSYFDITEQGNWSHAPGIGNTNILRILTKTHLFAAAHDISPGDLQKKIHACLERIQIERNRRIRPQLDDKILLNWNALMVTALAKAAAALADQHYRELAKKSFNFLVQIFMKDEQTRALYHSYKAKNAKFPAFLDDYAFLIQSCIYLQELTSDSKYLVWAKELTIRVLEDFTDEGTGLLFYTNKDQNDIIFRKRELYDGATPSGNSIMAENLFYLAAIFDSNDWYQKASSMSALLKEAIIRHPTSFGTWATVLLKQLHGLYTIVVVGPGYKQIQTSLLEHYLPFRVIQCGLYADPEFPLLNGKDTSGVTCIYLCRNQTCFPPFNNFDDLLTHLKVPPVIEL